MAKNPSSRFTESKIFTDLIEELPITREATTSRVVVNNEVLRFLLFSFDAGQVLTEHSSTRAVIVQLLSGKMEFTVGDTTAILSAGDVVYLAPDDRHALTALEPCHMALTMVDMNSEPIKNRD